MSRYRMSGMDEGQRGLGVEHDVRGRNGGGEEAEPSAAGCWDPGYPRLELLSLRIGCQEAGAKAAEQTLEAECTRVLGDAVEVPEVAEDKKSRLSKGGSCRGSRLGRT
jgi:hypothetical protein